MLVVMIVVGVLSIGAAALYANSADASPSTSSILHQPKPSTSGALNLSTSGALNL